MNDPPQDSRLPRGALIVVAVGLFACLAAAVLATSPGEGQAAELQWVKRAAVPDSKPVDVPGGNGQMRLVDGEIEATGSNFSGYALFLVGATLEIDAGAPVGDGQVLCTVASRQRTEIAQTSGGLRATFPRSSEAGIFSQDVPETLLVDFSARGGELVVLEPPQFESFTTERGVKLEWPEFEEGTENLKYFIAGGKPKQQLVLPFYTVWKTSSVPAADLSCTLTTSAGKATARTVAELKAFPPPIDEEAEEESEELAEEEAEEAEEEEG
ncbi:MAG TPA: hypothetical protein VFY48_06785 [Solirubrobacterales bacterium]|nr:hypothetical protein [Solirubrobacterales bacterium]